jgi:hypothetical protein
MIVAVAVLSAGLGSTVDLLLMFAVLLITVPLARLPFVVAFRVAVNVFPVPSAGNVINWVAVAGTLTLPPPLIALAAVWLYVNVVGVGTETTVNTPLKVVLATPLMVADCPAKI